MLTIRFRVNELIGLSDICLKKFKRARMKDPF